MSHITSSTIRAANAVQSAAAQEIKQSMSAVKGIFISVDVSAPIIVLPKSITSTPKETTLYISLGCIKFKTKPLPEKEKLRRIQSKEEKEENLYYSNKANFDRFFIEMTTVENAFLKPESGFMILPEVSVSANILQKIDDANLTRDSVIVRLRVPKLRLQLSVYQVFLLTDMIEAWVTYLRDSEEDAARFNPTVPLASNSSPLYPDYPANSSADDGGDSAPGYATHVSPTTGSPPAVQRSEHSARISALDGGNPVMRLELLVEQLGLDVFEGEGTLTVTQPPRFSLSFAHLEFILAKRENIMKIVLHFEHPTVLDYTAKEHPILSAPSVEVEVTNPKGQPVAVGVVAKPGVHFCLGTPFMELMETIMDIVNLILATKDYASAYEAYVPYVKESANEKEVCDDLLAYQLGMIKASNEAQDYRIVDISLLIEGKATVHFMNRGPNDTEDFLFASVDLNDFELYLKKNNVTLGLTGCIASVEASVCDSSELLEEYRLILSGNSTNGTNHSSAFSGSAASNPTVTSSTLKHSSDARSWSSMQSAPHVGFSYQTSRPVMPIFGQDENGKDVITNAAELRYSRSMELELGSSTLCVDVHTIMVIKNYFLSGFFSRITFLTDRTLYNGDSKKRAAPRPGPRLLLGMRVVANDVNIVIPPRCAGE
ncbi:hypothetical protein AGDE_14156 [Angomonas deanei]|uniref:Repeating coiled region of VPS13, putative n=1 Tax=Angomonas deanei TaxID=59799 RepID=A0A7G2C0K0_9TRYP|nr:hypothetical protein AGDE_14156 [Angomonas deanei]CAD2212721.1 Repeating coiled region of VPS13, putative [Angomonas deanei]|eukprot:EPY21330.1 hypothetical protein AGDE_14156 [Angomonas deanei]